MELGEKIAEIICGACGVMDCDIRCSMYPACPDLNRDVDQILALEPLASLLKLHKKAQEKKGYEVVVVDRDAEFPEWYVPESELSLETGYSSGFCRGIDYCIQVGYVKEVK